MTLLTSTIPPSLVWSILIFCIVQLIAIGKFILSLYSKIQMLETKLIENTTNDRGYLEETKKKLEAIASTFTHRDAVRDKFRIEVYGEIKEVESKVDSNDKELQKRINLMAQGLVKIEAILESKK